MRPARSKSWFSRFAKATSRATGRPLAFSIAASVILVWAVTGPIFHFSDTWQLVINTGTTVITFLMVFLIQATQNRDSEATQLKLDEIIRAIESAHNSLLDLEELEERDLDRIRDGYRRLADRSRRHQPEEGFDPFERPADPGKFGEMNADSDRRAARSDRPTGENE
jgi:low affinity Fe/Cu permease